MAKIVINKFDISEFSNIYKLSDESVKPIISYMIAIEEKLEPYC